jgi:high-affinity iron transporter
MIATFVIGLREGLEAALIVGIIAAFLVRNGDRRSVRAMWVGVGIAVAVCVVFAVGLTAAGRRMPLRARESMEGVLTLVAVGAVTYMIVWMKRNGRGLRSELESRAGVALAEKSAFAMAGMAFLAVIREGFETAIFLTATFGQIRSATAGALGAFLGVGVAIVLGYLIYRGGVRIDLARFFTITGALLVVVAAGLVATSLHEFTEAGFIGIGTAPALDLSWLVEPGTIRGSLITGFFGVQPVPSVIEVAAWIAFLAPMIWFVTRRSRVSSTRPGSPAV